MKNLAGVIAAVAGLVLATGCPVPPPPAPQTVVYVNVSASPGGNGASWETALTDLQAAILAAASSESITEIWVAAGVYHPAGPNGDRAAAFQLINGVALYGGFSATETAVSQRDPTVNVTTLSGDLNDDDDGFLNNGENSNNIVSGSGVGQTAVLDGFVITAGNANSEANPNGGGMIIASGSPTVRNCTFTQNAALQSGAGMLISNSSPTLTNCTFSDNQALANGGGTLNLASRPSLTDCTFSDNTATDGGGMFNREGSQPTLTNCTFTQNSATNGGGMFNRDASQPTLTNCTFARNTALAAGGGMYNFNSFPRMIGCRFQENVANGTGGAVANTSNSNPTLTNCRFLGNSALTSGGAVFNFVASAQLTNCVFSGNTSTSGGAMLNRDNSDPQLVNCTLSRNSATVGGGILNTFESSPVLTNCILWGNEGLGGTGPLAQIATESGSPVVTYSCVQGGWTGAGGTGNIEADPLFADDDGADNTPGTEDDNLRLSAGSPCIDAADNAAVPADADDLDGDGNMTEPIPADLAGNPRFIDDPATPDSGNPGTPGPPIVDMGAFEF